MNARDTNGFAILAMDNDPSIMCFRHCKTKSVFCRSIPTTCPVCSLRIISFIVDPFRIPYPLANATHCPSSIVIRPARGSFLDDYDVTHDLHIGIVDSKGSIVEFDKDGLIINNIAKWIDCIACELVPTAWIIRWDETLLLMLTDFKWRSANYDEIRMNCFNFVLEFFNNLGYENLKFKSKEDLCDKLILSKIQNVIRYCSLYRTLKSQEYLLSNNSI